MRLPIPLLAWAVSIRIERRVGAAWRLPRPRLRLRTLLLLVAIVAVILGGLAERQRRRELARRRQSYALLARKYAHAEWFHEWAASLGEHLIVTFGDPRGYRTVRLEVSDLKAVAQDERLMRRKYERAAADPGLPIEPDPPRSELERIADAKDAPRSRTPPAWPMALDPHPMRP